MRKRYWKTGVGMLLTAAMLMGTMTGCGGQNQNVPKDKPAGNETNMKENQNDDKGGETEPEKENQENKEGADLVLQNGLIRTMVSEEDSAQAVAVKGNEIVYVGDNEGAAGFIGDNTQVIDLDGKMVSPGFMDGHIHSPGSFVDRLFSISLEDCKTNEDYINKVKEFVEANPDREAYSGAAFSLNVYMREDGSNPGPVKEDLDSVCPDKPVVLYDVSHHSAWVNSKALKIAGITKDTKDPVGGRIGRNEKGEPSGYLTDTAVDFVSEIADSIEFTEEMYKEAIREFQKEANAYGITGICNILSSDSTGKNKVLGQFYKDLEDKGELTLRMRTAYNILPGMTTEEAIGLLNGEKSYESDMIKTGTVKMFVDGVTEGGTAVMLEPYLEAAGKGEGWTGEPIWEIDKFNEMVTALDKEGFQIHLHAIGDGAVKIALDSFEEAEKANGERDARYTMTHVSAIADEDIDRTADLGVISALQFLWMYNDELCELEKAFIGEERALAMYPVKTMLEKGCIISGASDTPVTDYNPLEEIEVAVTRNAPFKGMEDEDYYRTKEQAITVYQALEAYTKNVAYQNYMEEEIGTIEAGKKADLVVLSQDILTCEPKTISDTEIIYTISDGRIVYKK